MRSILTAAALLGAISLLPAQGFQCTLLGTHNQHAPYNDVWGYVAPNGKEYALLGATTGLVVLDCSNPATPIERGFFPWATSTWRDIRTYGHYAYVGSEGAGGFMIVDLANPDAPVNLGIFGSAYFGNSHNMCIDTSTGRIYCAGTNTGTPVFDASVNPANPPFVGYALGSGNSNYFHDLCVENGYGYGSMIYNGVLRIWDMSTFPPTTLSDAVTPQVFTHNAWPNAAGTIVATTDERNGGLVRFFDTTNKSAPVALGQITVNPTAYLHNAYIIGNLCHVSWYTEGYACIDISDPTTPIVVASYDTWPGATGGFNGAWGCYPFQPSGNVYISDISTGLYILKPQITDLAIAHTPLAGTQDESGPYGVTATLSSSNAIVTATVRYRLNGGALQSVAMTPTAVPGQYHADIPGQNAATLVEYHIDVTDSVAARRSPRIGEDRFLVGTHVTHWSDDFETATGWTHGGTLDDWQTGPSLGRAGGSTTFGWTDPVGAVSGNNVWGNDLGIPGFNGAYANSASPWLQSPAIATGSTNGLHLGFRRWLTLAAGDTARILVNGVQVFTTSAATTDPLWQWIDLDVSSVLNGQSTATIRFELTSGASGAAGGWTIDDLELFTLHDAVPATNYGTGTPGTGGLVPQLALSAPAVLGTTTNLLGSSMLANSLALLAVNLAPADFAALGVQILVDPNGAALLTAGISAGGTASWPFAVPPTLALDNVYVYAQVLPLDPNTPASLFAASSGMRFRTAISAP